MTHHGEPIPMAYSFYKTTLQRGPDILIYERTAFTAKICSSNIKSPPWYTHPHVYVGSLCYRLKSSRLHGSRSTALDPFTVYPKIYAHGFCFAVLCCGYTLTDFPISTRLTSLALWQSSDCPSASKATLMNMDKYFMWNHYERLLNHNKAKHNKTVCIFIGIYCTNIVYQKLKHWYF